MALVLERIATVERIAIVLIALLWIAAIALAFRPRR